MVVKMDVIFGKTLLLRHNLNTSPPKPMTSFVNDP